MLTIKKLAFGAAAVVGVGAAAAGLTAAAEPAGFHVQPVVYGAPLPQDPAPAPATAVPTAAQLTGLLNNLADPSVPFANKSALVEGGIGGTEAHLADHPAEEGAEERPVAAGVQHRQHPAGRQRGGHRRRLRLRSQVVAAGHPERHLRQPGRLGAVPQLRDGAVAGRLALTRLAAPTAQAEPGQAVRVGQHVDRGEALVGQRPQLLVGEPQSPRNLGAGRRSGCLARRRDR